MKVHLGDILTIVTDRMVAPDHISAVYRLCDYMTGDTLFTHQLPRASDECRPALLAQHPWLADIQPPAEFVDEAHVWRWLAEQVAQYGEMHEVQPLAPADHTSIDPLDELAMNHPGIQVIPVVIDETEAS